jgi:hypothetical protein
MVSASLWAEPFLVLVTVAQRDVTGGEKYFWRPSTLVSALGGSSHAIARCVMRGGDGVFGDGAEAAMLKSTSRVSVRLQNREMIRRMWSRRGDKTGRSATQC